jgi:ubiquinone/menaquinone biosynthesis C-methylase UbiE
MSSKKWNFDEEAATWDKNPGRVKVANDIADAILDEQILTPEMNLLEFGCGTGLLTLRLLPLVRSVTGVDSSEGMLGVLRKKIQDQNLTNLRLQHLDLQKGDTLGGSYDLVICSMTLHHVKETGLLLDQLFKVTAPCGHLCIADLDPDDGQFHGDNDTVFHHGFDRTDLRRAIEDAGYKEIHDRMAATITKPIAGGGTTDFGVFLMTGRKAAESGTTQPMIRHP